MDRPTKQSITEKSPLLRKMKDIFNWPRHGNSEAKDRKQVLRTFSYMRKVAIKKRNETVFNQLRDDRLLQTLLNDIKKFEDCVTAHKWDKDHTEWQWRMDKILELQETIKMSNFTIRRLNNNIINCSKYIKKIQNTICM